VRYFAQLLYFLPSVCMLISCYPVDALEPAPDPDKQKNAAPWRWSSKLVRKGTPADSIFPGRQHRVPSLATILNSL
jgi:hypothetical protein